MMFYDAPPFLNGRDFTGVFSMEKDLCTSFKRLNSEIIFTMSIVKILLKKNSYRPALHFLLLKKFLYCYASPFKIASTVAAQSFLSNALHALNALRYIELIALASLPAFTRACV